MEIAKLDFAGLLKHFRARSGLTREQLSRRAGVSASSVYLYESGRGVPKLATAKQLAAELKLEQHERSLFLDAASPLELPDASQILDRLDSLLREGDIPQPLKHRLVSELRAVLANWERDRARPSAVRTAIIAAGGWQSRALGPDLTARLIRNAAAEITEAGLDRIVLVVSPAQKQDLPSHLGKIPRVKFLRYAVQEVPRGFGHAVLVGQRAGMGHRDEPLAVVTPDEAVPSACLREMIELYRESQTPVVAVRKLEQGSHRLYGVVSGSRKGKVVEVTGLEEKPKRPPHSGWLLLGRYIFPPAVFDFLAKTEENSVTRSIELTDALQAMIVEKHSITAFVHRRRFSSLSLSLRRLIAALGKR